MTISSLFAHMWQQHVFCAKTSVCGRYINNVFQNFAIFGHGIITTVFKRCFFQAFAAEFEFV